MFLCLNSISKSSKFPFPKTNLWCLMIEYSVSESRYKSVQWMSDNHESKIVGVKNIIFAWLKSLHGLENVKH